MLFTLLVRAHTRSTPKSGLQLLQSRSPFYVQSRILAVMWVVILVSVSQ